MAAASEPPAAAAVPKAGAKEGTLDGAAPAGAQTLGSGNAPGGGAAQSAGGGAAIPSTAPGGAAAFCSEAPAAGAPAGGCGATHSSPAKAT